MSSQLPHDGLDPDTVRARARTAAQDVERLEALRSLGVLDGAPDPNLDRLTTLAAKLLRAPVALMSFVDEDRQFFASQVGLDEPWATQRETPLSHSFCQHVIASGQPMRVSDARLDPVLADNLAIPDLGVVAYAGVPIHDGDGHQLGSFCVIDGDAREWTDDELHVLETLSTAIVSEMALRQSLDKERRATKAATEAIRSLLAMQRITAELSGAMTSEEVFTVLIEVAQRTQATQVAFLAAPATGEAWLHEATIGPDKTIDKLGPTVPGPGHRLRAQVDGAETGHVGGAPDAGTAAPAGGGRSVWRVRTGERTIAAVELTWDDRLAADEGTANLMAATSSSLGPVVERIFLREDERERARELQLGLLPRRIPEIPGLEIEVAYHPAVQSLDVGGDWYDVVEVDEQHVLLVVGDANGHSARAAAVMASLRFGLRALAREDADPGWLLGELNRSAYADESLATVLVMLLQRRTGEFFWASAGHPPAIVADRDGARQLEEHGPMLGAVEDATFATQVDHLLPGETLMLYSDGLVEGRTEPMDLAVGALAEHLATDPAAHPSDIVRFMQARPGMAVEDDIALLVVRRLAD